MAFSTNKPQPKVSVILPVLNGQQYLKQAIESVLQQDVPLELIVVDDGSSDNTAEIAKSFSDRVRYIYQSNNGVAAARNAGVAAACADILAFIDADDLWPEGKLAHQLKVLASQPDLVCVSGRIQQFSDSDSEAVVSRTLHGEPYYCYVLGSALFRASAFEKIGCFDESMRLSSDMDWFVRLREVCYIEKLDMVSLLYRYRRGSLTFGKGFLERQIPAILKQSLDRRRSRQS